MDGDDGGYGGYGGNNDSREEDKYGPGYNGGDDSKDYGPGYNAGNESKDYGPGYNGGNDFFSKDSYDNNYDDIKKVQDDKYSKNHVDAITSCDDDDVTSPDGSLGRTLVTALAAMGPAALASATANDKAAAVENGFAGPDYNSALLIEGNDSTSHRRQKDDVEDTNCTKDCLYYSLTCCYDCSLM